MAHDLTRRRLLRSTLNGAAVALALPILDMALDTGGEAFAATGAPLPVRFGTWHWGCGMNPHRWVPASTGAAWEMTPELEPLAAFRKDINLFTGFAAMLDGRANEPHVSAVWALRTGYAPRSKEDIRDPSFDVLIARAIGNGVRFRSLDMAATGGETDSYSSPGGNAIAAPMPSPLALYNRVFGLGFQDPNASTFTPDPETVLRQSVLSAFGEERAALMKGAGATDRQKLEAYFTSVRELEQQLSLELEKPAPAEACVVPRGTPKDIAPSTEIGQVIASHKLLVDLTVMALQCHQTKVFNIVFSPSASSLRKAGAADTHHMLTHQEPVDEKLGYQPDSTWYAQTSLDALAYLLGKLQAAQEGGRSLLDNLLVYAHSDTSFAKMHALDELPVIMAGRAGGRLKTGLHVRSEGAPVTRTALTAMQAVGMRAGSFGSDQMATSQPIGEVLV
jgi:Protein of unknown function (DUF1552)